MHTDVSAFSLAGSSFTLLIRPNLRLHRLPVNFEVLRKLLELFVGLFAAVHLQEALSVRHHSVHVSLVLHCDFQSSIPLVQLDVQLDRTVVQSRLQ